MCAALLLSLASLGGGQTSVKVAEIDRVSIAEIDTQSFLAYIKQNKPIILTNAAEWIAQIDLSWLDALTSLTDEHSTNAIPDEMHTQYKKVASYPFSETLKHRPSHAWGGNNDDRKQDRGDSTHVDMSCSLHFALVLLFLYSGESR